MAGENESTTTQGKAVDPASALFGVWLPIETAPEDGTWVLITTPESHPRAACYDNKEGTFHDWESDSFFAGGWTDYDDDGPPWHLKRRYSPTHWMPLPAPPNAAGQTPRTTSHE